MSEEFLFLVASRSSELTCESMLPSDVSIDLLTPLLVPARRVGKQSEL